MLGNRGDARGAAEASTRWEDAGLSNGTVKLKSLCSSNSSTNSVWQAVADGAM